ncbi:MAG: hypothetical protein ACEY26_00470 [Candidatus Hodgkinia cicadicola]
MRMLYIIYGLEELSLLQPSVGVKDLTRRKCFQSDDSNYNETNGALGDELSLMLTKGVR